MKNFIFMHHYCRKKEDSMQILRKQRNRNPFFPLPGQIL